ncbi:MAG TPA: styrene monooxygenase/indole monooxygenase family protein [Rhizomicrobium sp.]|nr:styrene monooxygenase/indole monooxygenase family protein [Rhizomicrobium sp.]
MDRKIGIVGAGTAGLHLALYLQRHGLQPIVITERNPDQVAGMRLPNSVGHHFITLDRERSLDVCHWSAEEVGYMHHHHYFNLPRPLAFSGKFTKRSRAVDYRVYLPRLMTNFMTRGGTIEYREIGADDIAKLAARFDLLVVSSGRGPLARLFEPIPEVSLPQALRTLTVGIFTGVRSADPQGVTLSVSPGNGELIDMPTFSFSGPIHALLMESVPGGELEAMTRLRYDDNPRLFLDTLLATAERHFPTIYEHIDRARFDLQGPLGQLYGSVTPTVRRSHVDLGDGKMAIALGDVHIAMDPVAGQGANVASYAAFILGEEILRTPAFDRLFCETVARRREERILSAYQWTNAMILPPSNDFLQLLGAMSQYPVIADEFTESFNYPERQWARIASPDRIRAWIAEAASATAV